MSHQGAADARRPEGLQGDPHRRWTAWSTSRCASRPTRRCWPPRPARRLSRPSSAASATFGLGRHGADLGDPAPSTTIIDYKTEILAASVRTVNHVKEAALIGADVMHRPRRRRCSALVKHPLTDKGSGTVPRRLGRRPARPSADLFASRAGRQTRPVRLLNCIRRRSRPRLRLTAAFDLPIHPFDKIPQRDRIVSDFGILCREEQRGRPAFNPLPQVSSSRSVPLQFVAVSAAKLLPFLRIVAEPAAQLRARRDVLQRHRSTPASSLRRPRGHGQSTRTLRSIVAVRSRLVNALHLQHDRSRATTKQRAHVRRSNRCLG